MKIRKHSILSMFIGAFVLPIAADAADVKYEISGCSHNEGTIIGQTEGVMLGATEVNGNYESNVYGNGGYRCRNVFTVVGKTVEFTGVCRFTDGKGNDTFGRYVGSNGTWDWKFLGGTGSFAGISGGGPGKNLKQFPGAKPGTSFACWDATGTHKVPN